MSSSHKINIREFCILICHNSRHQVRYQCKCNKSRVMVPSQVSVYV